MKVALLGSYPTWPFREHLELRRDTRHITSTWNVNLADALSRRPGIEVHFVTLAAGIPRSRILRSHDSLWLHFLRMTRREKGVDLGLGYAWSTHRLGRYLRRIDPDLAHGIGTEHPYALSATRLSYPSVITVHGVVSRVVEVMGAPRWSYRRMVARLERRALRRARNVIVISRYVLDVLPTDIRGLRTFDIENPIARDFFEGQPADDRARKGIVFVGMIQPRKGLDVLLRAVSLLSVQERPEWLKIIGGTIPGHSGYEAVLKAYARERALDEFVQWIGPLEQAVLRQELRAARALVLPSREETAPMAIAEAFACGTPVVASDVGGVRYMIEPGITGFLVPPDSPSELADALRAVLALDSRCAAQRARQVSEARYHPDRVAAATERVYRSVLDTHLSEAPT